MISVTVNGKDEQFQPGTTVADLLDKLGRKPLGLAVEINREIVPRSMHGQTQLQPGDKIEIVHMVGGG